MQSYGYKVYDFEDCEAAEAMLKEMYRLSVESGPVVSWFSLVRGGGD